MMDDRPIPAVQAALLAGLPVVVRLVEPGRTAIILPLSERGIEQALAGAIEPAQASALAAVPRKSTDEPSPIWRYSTPPLPPLPPQLPDLPALDRLLLRQHRYQPLLLRSTQPSPGHLRQVLHVPADLAWFDGHFPGAPILPGVVQLKWAVEAAAAVSGFTAGPISLQQLKFKKPIRADVILELALDWTDDGAQVAFRYRSADGEHSSGRFSCRAG